jgi:hypothetical protein
MRCTCTTLQRTGRRPAPMCSLFLSSEIAVSNC